MTAGNWVEVVLIALLVANMVAVGLGLRTALDRLTKLVENATDLVQSSRAEAAATLAEANRVIARIEALSETTERVLTEDLSPVLTATRSTLGHLESAARGAGESIQTVRRVVSTAESIVTPAAALAAAGRAMRTPGGKATAAAAIIGVVTQLVTVVRARNAQSSSPTKATGE